MIVANKCSVKFIPHLLNEANSEQTRAHVVHVQFEHVCFMFASSCKGGIKVLQYVGLDLSFHDKTLQKPDNQNTIGHKLKENVIMKIFKKTIKCVLTIILHRMS